MPTPWISVARQLLGQREIIGTVDNPTVVEMFRLIEQESVHDDETPWCAAFVGACLELSAYRSTRSALARSYLKWGRKLEIPEPGCIVVLWRGTPDGDQGHVAFFVRETANDIILLGGNQSNSVSEQAYNKNRLLGYRWPEMRLPGPAHSSLIKNISEIERALIGAPSDSATSEGVFFPPPFAEIADDSGFSGFGSSTANSLPRSGAPPTNDQRTLARPMVGEDVRALQAQLKQLGYPVGGIDGEFGPMTETAVFEFQCANGLPGTGIADGATMAALVGGKGPEIAEQRRNITEEELLEKGSNIISDARAGRWAAVAAGVLGLFGLSDANLGILQNLSDAIGTGEDSPNLLRGVVESLPALLGNGGGVWAGLLGAGLMGWRYFSKAARARVEDHSTGRNRDH